MNALLRVFDAADAGNDARTVVVTGAGWHKRQPCLKPPGEVEIRITTGEVLGTGNSRRARERQWHFAQTQFAAQ